MARALLDVDLLSGFAAVGWAIVALWLPELAALCSPTVAFAFGTVAQVRGLKAVRKRLDAEASRG